MFNFFTRIMDYISRTASISDITLKLMGIAIMLMALVFLFHIFFKREDYARNMTYAGIAARGIMLVALTLEMYHHTSIYPFTAESYNKESVLSQVLNLLMFGYIIVAGVYDILTVHVNKWRGFFHSFDIAVVSMPVLYGFMAIIAETLTNRLRDYIIIGWLLLAFVGFLYYLFFQLYWRKSMIWYFILLLLSGTIALYSKSVGVQLTLGISIFIFLLGLYELGRTAYSKAIKMMPDGILRRFKTAAVMVPVIIIFMANPVFSIWTIAAYDGDIYKVRDVFRKDYRTTTLKEAEDTARNAVKDYENKLYLSQNLRNNFHNIYFMTLGDYSIDVMQTFGRNYQVHYRMSRGEYTPKTVLSPEEIVKKTLEYIGEQGYTYDEKYLYTEVIRNGNYYNVNIYHRYSDGSIKKDTPVSPIIWALDGKMIQYISGFYNIGDYPDIKLDYDEIDGIITNLYKALGREKPSYAVSGYSNMYFKRYPELQIECKNGDMIAINSDNGLVQSYQSQKSIKSEKVDLDDERARMIAKDFINSFMYPEDINKPSIYQCEITSPFGWLRIGLTLNNKQLKISMNIDSKGNIQGFLRENDIKPEISVKRDSIKVSKMKALELVRSRYGLFSIYNKKIQLIRIIDENDDVTLNWMVSIIPFRSPEHHIYFVDALTGAVTPLEDYKAGVKSE